MNSEEIEKLSQSAKVVVFRSPVTDLGGLDHLLDRHGRRWRSVELAMGDAANRERFEALKRYTGHATLPQVFVDGHFVGGIGAARETLEEAALEDGPSSSLSGAATVASYFGLVPFIGLAAWLWAHPVAGAAGPILAIYAAIVLSFVGAVHFGWALGEHVGARHYWWSTVPAIGAWVLASLPAMIGLPLLAAGFAGVWYAERRWFSRELPGWYRGLRTQLTFAAGACIVAAWIAVLVHG